jgi:MFS family permease
VLRLALALFLAQTGFHAFLASLPLAMLAAGRGDAEIGAIMGSSALMQLAAAFVAGGLIDRYGGRLVFLGGVAAYVVACVLLAAGIVGAASGDVPLIAVRLLQGVGIATCLPASFSLVPALVDARRLATALSLVGVAANVSLAAAPPLSLAVLDAVSLQAVALATLVLVLAAAVVMWRSAPPERARTKPEGRLRTFRPAWRSAWLVPLLLAFLFVTHWGVVTGFLPQRAAQAGADVGLFFTADAVALLLLRVPAGYLADRFGSLWLIVGGVAVTVASLVLLLPSPTTPLLILSGLGTGAGGALFLPPVTVELSRRSDDADRGSAYSLFSVAFSGAIAVGSIVAAPAIAVVGFEPTLVVGIGFAVAAGVLAFLDRSLRTAAPHSTARVRPADA